MSAEQFRMRSVYHILITAGAMTSPNVAQIAKCDLTAALDSLFALRKQKKVKLNANRTWEVATDGWT